MKTLQDPLQCTSEVQPSSHVSHESQGDQQSNPGTEAPVVDSGSITISSSDSRKVSREDIELVQNLIERCLQLYMNRGEVVKTLQNRARIEPGFTSLVWQKLEEENSDFFRAYYIRLKLKKQIILFNHLLEHQYHLMNYPVPQKVALAPIQNGIHPMPVNNLPMGYPVMQQPPIPATGQPHLDPMACGLSSCHVVNGVPAPGNFHPIRMNSSCDNVMDGGSADAAPSIPPCSAMSSMSEMAVSPTSVASSGHFPFTPQELSGMGVDTSALDSAFTTDVATTGGLVSDGGPGNTRDSLKSLAQIPWNFSLSDLTADLSNMGDLGALGNYTGSPFLPSGSDILLDSPEHDDLGFFLNPRFQYQEGFEYNDSIRSGVTKVIERLAPNVTFAIEATREIAQFQGKIGRFEDLTAQTAIGIMNPVEEFFVDSIPGPCSQSDEEKS